jgi:hypothetical protein
MPWTPRLLDEFQNQKAYDPRSCLPLFFAPRMTGEARRAKADYWDVRSDMFRNAFFKMQTDWYAANNLDHLMHENREEFMIAPDRGGDLIRNQGDFFRCMRFVQAPGVDNLNQIRPGVVADFPDLASSAGRHLYGRPKIRTENGGGASTPPVSELLASVRLVAAERVTTSVARIETRGSSVCPPPSAGWLRERARSHL